MGINLWTAACKVLSYLLLHGGCVGVCPLLHLAKGLNTEKEFLVFMCNKNGHFTKFLL